MNALFQFVEDPDSILGMGMGYQ